MAWESAIILQNHPLRLSSLTILHNMFTKRRRYYLAKCFFVFVISECFNEADEALVPKLWCLSSGDQALVTKVW